MRKSRFTEAQIIGMIKEQEAGLPTSELCRKHGLSPATFYKLKAKYGGMDLSDAKRLKQLEDENAKLKRAMKRLVGGWWRAPDRACRGRRPPRRSGACRQLGSGLVLVS
jgi:putative transposase